MNNIKVNKIKIEDIQPNDARFLELSENFINDIEDNELQILGGFTRASCDCEIIELEEVIIVA